MGDFRHTLFLKIASLLWTLAIVKTSVSPSVMSIQVFAGNDTTICRDASLELVQLRASISGDVTDGDWISLGDGYFTPTNSDKARFSSGVSYQPGPNDKTIGQFKLLLISDAPSPNSPNGKVTDEVNITLQTAPALTCSVNVNVSLDENCQQVIIPSMLTTNPVPPYTSYIITLYDPNNAIIPNATLTHNYLDQSITYKLGHNCTPNVCRGTIKVEDYYAPIFSCKNDTINCFESIAPLDLGFPIPNGAIVDTFIQNAWIIKHWDKCSDVTLTMKDSIAKQTCDKPFDRIIYRSWIAKDAKLNTSKCKQIIYITRKTLQDIIFPPHFDGIESPFFDCADDFTSLSNGFPSPDTTGYPLIGTCENLEFSMSDTKFPMCGNGFKVVRNWFVIEWCTALSMTKNQIIEVRDNSAPNFVCPAPTTVSTGAYTCGIDDYILPLPTDILDCSDYTIDVTTRKNNEGKTGTIIKTNNTYHLDVTSPGTYPIVYTVKDICQNQANCEMLLTVQDDMEPNMVCDQHTKVILDDQGIGRMFATTLDDGSNDNCGIKGFEVRKMRTSCGVAPSFKTYVDFCCEDIANSPLMVELKAIDNYGNTNTCMVEVSVEDKISPKITCPPDISVECTTNLDSLSLIQLGMVHDNPSKVKNISVFNAFHNGIVGHDGLASDNCNVQISLKINDYVTCHQGYIEKTFTAVDNFNNKSTCTQTIYVVNPDPFGENDIIWPADYFGQGCKTSDLAPTKTGEPKLTNTSCGSVAATYSDQEFYIADGACLKIIRTWTVVDWCQFDEQTFEGKWGPHVQTIKLANTIAPTITTCAKDTIVCIYDPNCQQGVVSLPFSAKDDCTADSLLVWSHAIDYNRDGVIDQNLTEKNITHTLPLGFHRIRTIVEDKCGNYTECATLLEVKDCKKPTPYCHSQLTITINDDGYSSEIWAVDFNKDASDNCTAKEDLLFTFFDAIPNPSKLNNVHYFKGNGLAATESEFKSGQAQKWNPDSNSSAMIFRCSDLPNGISDTVTLDMVVTDSDGNTDVCIVDLVVQDSGDFCEDLITSNRISGSVKTELGVPIANSIVTCTSPENHIFTTKTNSAGQYTFDGLPINNTYIIESRITDQVMEGVSTLDLVFIQRHILDIAPFTSPYQYLSADANYSKSVTVADLSELRKLILLIKNSFPNGNDPWMCIPKDTAITNLSYPYNVTKVQEVQLTKNHQDSVHFIAIKKGDVNNSYTNNANIATQSREANFLPLLVKNIIIDGEHFITFSFEHDLYLDGFQLFIDNVDVQQNIEITSPLDNFDYNIIENSFRSVGFAKKPLKVKAGEPLLSLPVRHPIHKLDLLSDSEVYIDQKPLKVHPIPHQADKGQFSLINTMIANNTLSLLCSGEMCTTSYSIYSYDGKLMQQGVTDNVANGNVVEIPLNPMPTGMYVLRLDYDGKCHSQTFVIR